jgi:hypothetical protein
MGGYRFLAKAAVVVAVMIATPLASADGQALAHEHPACTVPSAPVNFTATGGSNAASFTWTAPSGNGTALDAYMLRVESGPNFGQSVALDPSDTSATMTSLTSGAGITFSLGAHSACGLGPAAVSNAVSVIGAAPTYDSAVLADQPAVFYRMADSATALMADSSGNEADGVYDPGVAELGAPGPLANDSSTGVASNGGPQLATAASPQLSQGASPRTVEMWVQDTYDESGRALVSWGNTGMEDGAFTVYETADGVAVDAGNDYHALTSPYPLDDGVWHLITVTFSGSQLTMYVDGVPIGSTAFTGTLDTSGTSLAVGSSLITGSMADLAIYPTALSAATVAAHFTDSGLGRPGPAQVVHAGYGGPNASDISWGAAAAPGTGVTGYVVTALNGPSAGASVSAVSDATAARIYGLAAGSYAFRVQAVDSYGLGAAAVSNTVTVTGAASTYTSAVLADHPAVFYRMADSSLVVLADSSGHGSEGVYDPGSVAGLAAPGPLVGDPSTAAASNGGQQMASVDIAKVPQGDKPRTVEMWVQDTYHNPSETLANWGSPAYDNQGFTIAETADGVSVDTGNSTGYTLTSPYPLDDGAWHLLTVTYNHSRLAMYVDGAPIGSVTLTSPLATSGTSLAIGTYFLTGTLADLAIYPTALSPATIATHFTDSGVTREDNSIRFSHTR